VEPPAIRYTGSQFHLSALTTLPTLFKSLWARHLLAALLGAIAVSGFAPFYIYPAGVLSLTGFFYLVTTTARPREAAWLGFTYGLGLFGAGIYWIYISLHDFGGMPFWMAGLATFLLCAFLALFPAIVAALARSRPAHQVLIALPLLWALSEWVRSWIFTGFPWLSIGYTQVPDSPLAGYAPIIGAYGVSLVVALLASLLVSVYLHPARRRMGVVLMVVLIGCGWALKQIEWSQPEGEPVSVALLQGNVSQDKKWNEEEVLRSMRQYYDMALASQARLIILPETALSVLLQQVPQNYLDGLKQHAQTNGGDILIGVVEYEHEQYYNSMMSVGSADTQFYRKSHLVPFGEFIPLKRVFGWIYRDWLNMPLADVARGGLDQQPMQVAGQRVAVNICYEDVFGEEIIRQLPQASILVNTSNDAWYGESIAAYQHLQFSQMRAIETARMMLRSTNTGATAIINSKGEVLAHAPHFIATTLEGEAQAYVGTTPYVRFGNWPLLILLAGSLALLWGRKTK
jgi:apolipoprotein N-acyltransferase